MPPTRSDRPDALGLELRPGLHTWEAFHPEWREDVRSSACVSERSVTLIDPQLPRGAERGRWLRALDRLVLERTLSLFVVTTVHWHARDARQLIARYGARARWWCPAAQRALPRPVRRFRPGARLPGGLQAVPTARGDEVLLWLPRARALFAGDVLLGGKRPALRLCPAGWLPRGVSRVDLAVSLAPALSLPIELLHLGHGAPIVSDASECLAAALGAAKHD